MRLAARRPGRVHRVTGGALRLTCHVCEACLCWLREYPRSCVYVCTACVADLDLCV